MNSSNLDDHPVANSSDYSQSVPVIDLGGRNVVDEIAQAAKEWGFFQIIGHGIPRTLTDEAISRTKRFFDLSVEEKNTVRRTRDNPWGYYNNELTKNQRDKKEVFDFTVNGSDQIYHANNRWPEFDAGFRSCMTEYLDAGMVVAMRLLEAFAVGLGLAATALHNNFSPLHTSFVRLNHYTTKDPLGNAPGIGRKEKVGLGVHHHSDAGAFTLLLQYQVSGLQVYKDSRWHNVPPLNDALVINTADMMQVWSNDIYKAPVHRVLAMTSEERISIPLFVNPAANALVQPVPTVVSASRPAVYRRIEWAEFRRRRTDGDYADYGSEVQIKDYRL